MTPSRIYIKPGEYHVTDKGVIITTLLGSCVSACLYDPVQKIIGMNHFLLSNKRYARDLPFSVTEAGRYGVHAMELLINAMLKLGAKRENLRAKAFGGASLLKPSSEVGNFFCVGEVNARFIREFLSNDGIPLVASDLGGDRGRVIYFKAEDFSVYMRKIQKTISYEVCRKERLFWEEKINIQEKEAPEPEIWQ